MSSTPRKPLSYVPPPPPPSSLHPSDYITSPAKLQRLLSILKHRPPTRAEYAALLDYEGRARIRKREEMVHPNVEFSTPIGADLHGCYKQFTEAFGTFKHWENAEDFDDSDQDDQWPLVDDWVLEDELNAIEQRDKRRDYRKKATRWEYEQILQKYEPTYAAAMTKELKSKSLAMGGDAKSINRLTQQHKPTMMVLLELAEEVARLEMLPEQGDVVSELTASRRSNGVPNASSGCAPSSAADSISPPSLPPRPQNMTSMFKRTEYLTIKVVSDMPQEVVQHVTIQVLCTASLADFRETAEIKWPLVRKFAKQHLSEIAREMILDDEMIYDEGKEGGWWDVGQHKNQDPAASNDNLYSENPKTSLDSVTHAKPAQDPKSRLEQKPEIVITKDAQQGQMKTDPEVTSRATQEPKPLVLNDNGHDNLLRTVLEIKDKQHMEHGLLYSPSVSDTNSPITPLFLIPEVAKDDSLATTSTATCGWWYQIVEVRTLTPESASSRCSERKPQKHMEIIEDWRPIVAEEDWNGLKHILVRPGAGHGRGKVQAYLRHESSVARQLRVEKERVKEDKGLGWILGDAGGIVGGIAEYGDNATAGIAEYGDNALMPFNIFLDRHRENCPPEWDLNDAKLFDYLNDGLQDGDDGGREEQSGRERPEKPKEETGMRQRKEQEEEEAPSSEETITSSDAGAVGRDPNGPSVVESDGLDDLFE